MEKLLQRYSVDPTPAAEAELLNALESTIRTIACTTLSRPVNDDELQNARLGALECLRHYIPEKGPLLFLLPFYVRKSLSRNRFPLVHIPYHVRLLWSKRKAYRDRYFAEHGIEPTIEETCHALGVKPAQLALVDQATLARRPSLTPHLPDPETPPAFNAERLDFENALSRLRQHNPQAAQAVMLKYYDELTVNEIADALGVYRNTVTKLLKTASIFLKENLAY